MDISVNMILTGISGILLSMTSVLYYDVIRRLDILEKDSKHMLIHIAEIKTILKMREHQEEE